MRLNPLDYGKSKHVVLQGPDLYRVDCFNKNIDQLISSLTQRIAAYEEAERYFGFLRNLHNLPSHDIEMHAQKLLKLYKEDIDDNLIAELIHFKEFSKEFIANNEKNEENVKKVSFETKMHDLIVESSLEDVFPNVYTVLRIYLVLMTTNCADERSFSKLKLLKNYLRSSTEQDRLNALAILSMSNDILRKMKFDDVINDFADKSSRKVIL